MEKMYSILYYEPDSSSCLWLVHQVNHKARFILDDISEMVSNLVCNSRISPSNIRVVQDTDITINVTVSTTTVDAGLIEKDVRAEELAELLLTAQLDEDVIRIEYGDEHEHTGVVAKIWRAVEGKNKLPASITFDDGHTVSFSAITFAAAPGGLYVEIN